MGVSRGQFEKVRRRQRRNSYNSIVLITSKKQLAIVFEYGFFLDTRQSNGLGSRNKNRSCRCSRVLVVVVVVVRES